MSIVQRRCGDPRKVVASSTILYSGSVFPKEGSSLLSAFSLSTWLFQDYTILTLKSKESEAENTVQGAAHKLNKPASCCNISDLM